MTSIISAKASIDCLLTRKDGLAAIYMTAAMADDRNTCRELSFKISALEARIALLWDANRTR